LDGAAFSGIFLIDRPRPPGFGKNDGWGFLGTGHPVIQAPVAGVEGGKLTAVVSSAGAVGSLASAVLSLERLR
jgi:hypothetical protein